MKEYVAKSGGRYTYSDDILNLQELALCQTNLFAGCSAFIISGCEINGPEITPGYVWLNNKVRFFEGCKDAIYPYYIYEVNIHESVTYANDVNKRGRTCYLCTGSKAVPAVADSVTGQLPLFIKITESYCPRLIDKFIGNYAVLLDSPFSRQTIKKDLVVTGSLTGHGEISSKTALTVTGDNGYELKNLVQTTGDVSVGLYLSGLLINEIVLCIDGTIRFMKKNKEFARIGDDGVITSTLKGDAAHVGSIVLSENELYNGVDPTDAGDIKVNFCGYAGGSGKFRNFAVYDGKGSVSALLKVIGKERKISVNGSLCVSNPGGGIELKNTSYLKGDVKLTNLFTWKDSGGEIIGTTGFGSTEHFGFTIKNHLGDIVLLPLGCVNIVGILKINDTAIGDLYVSHETFNDGMDKKVATEAGKQLSNENFTTELKRKLDGISLSTLASGGGGFVTAMDVSVALEQKLDSRMNFRDVMDHSVARENLDVYSKEEVGDTFLKISGQLIELVTLSADEINGLTTEEAAALKEEKQTNVRKNILAERQGIGELKLAKDSNLSDVSDKVKARHNIDVYSIEDIDLLLIQKLDIESAYVGIPFTEVILEKIDSIKTGNFTYMDSEDKNHPQTEGYVMTSEVVKELEKKANLLLEGYNSDQKTTIAANLEFYTKTASDSRFTTIEGLFQDYITFLVKGGKTTAQAQQILREKLDVFSKDEVIKNYVRRDGKLLDLSLVSLESKRQACQAIGAAFSTDYQPLLKDSGWQQMNNSGSATNAYRLYVRQIGNIVSIQGIINTSKRDGSNWGGVVALLPNSVSPPKYSVRCCAANWDSDAKYNRGTTFVLSGNTRQIKLYESGMYNEDVELNFTYFV